MWQVLASLDIFVHLSVWDTAAYAVREAMAMALPVVALKSNQGVAEYVQHNVSGVVVPSLAVEHTAAAVWRLLCSPGTRRSLGQQGQVVVRQASPMSNFVQRHASLYSTLWLERAEAKAKAAN